MTRQFMILAMSQLDVRMRAGSFSSSRQRRRRSTPVVVSTVTTAAVLCDVCTIVVRLRTQIESRKPAIRRWIRSDDIGADI
jgi:hypothetical protein